MTKQHKLLAMAFATLLIFASCGKDENENESGDEITSHGTKIKRITGSTADENEERTVHVDFTWDGDKIASVLYCYDSSTFTHVFTYDGDNIIREVAEGGTYDYTYAGGRIDSVTLSEYSRQDSFIYKYSWSGNKPVELTQPEDAGYYRGGRIQTLEWQGDNLVKHSGNSGTDWSITYRYDDKKNPFPFMFTLGTMPDELMNSWSVNNITEIIRKSGDKTYHTTYEYTYNADGYPATAKARTSYGDIITLTYTYYE